MSDLQVPHHQCVLLLRRLYRASFAGFTSQPLTCKTMVTIKAAQPNSTPTLVMGKILRIGMVGYGFMGKAHSTAWRQVPHFFPLKSKIEMHTICGRDRARVETARGQLGWQYAVTDWREVVESPLIDIVDITTPNDSHAEIAIVAAWAGKHVM